MESEQTLAGRLHLDLPLVFGLLLLSAIGLLVLYSAGGQDSQIVMRQGIRLLAAFGVMFFLAQVPPHHYLHWAPWLYSAGIILLLGVLVVGYEGRGAQRWLAVGGLQFQPSELVKVTVPMMVAYYLCDRAWPPPFKNVCAAAALVILPTLLIARQPDLGTALMIASSGAFALLLAGVRWRVVAVIGILAGVAAPIAWMFMYDYQRQRVVTFLNPGEDPLGAGYNIIQSEIAIGSGGAYGKGWLNGTQSQLDFLPERSTDFIFAVFSEEFGLLGAIALLAIYLFVVARGLYIAQQAQESFSRLLAGSLILTFFIYIVVNIGMVSGLLPVVGSPLPLISYGGTSLVTIMVAFGILMSVHTHRRLLSDK